MRWLGPATAGWPRLMALVFFVVTAGAPCLAGAQDTAPDQQAPDQPAMLATPTISGAPGDVAVPAGLDDRGRSLDCMSMAIAYEAAGQPVEGQQAVGQVILNRVRDPRFPKTVCGVVFQGSTRLTGCQFTFTCDGSFRRRLADVTLAAARGIAETVMAGAAPDRVAGATHYHADYVLPYWAASGQRVTRIGAHIFYRMPGNARAGLRPWPRPGPVTTLALATQAVPHAIFSPWGLPVEGVAQR